MAYENNDKKLESVYSARIRAGKRRTYFFDVRATRGNDYYLTITESRKRFNEDGYDRHKIFLYKEDFNKFLKGLTESIDYVKTDLMPDFDFDAFNHDTPYDGGENNEGSQNIPTENENIASENNIPSEESDEKQSDTSATGIAPAATPEIDVKPNDEEVDKW
ncbi:MAG: hypothetical protein JWN83_2000 [Chitinophagaceae bacterium]|nr:hypothetical protein [Chitinophagaceae bacterium]